MTDTVLPESWPFRCWSRFLPGRWPRVEAMKTFWSKSCRSTGNSIRTAEEGKKILIKRERNNGLMLYVLSPVSFLFLFCFIGFIGFMVFSRTGLIALQRTLPAFLFFFLFYFSLDRLIAKPEELRITIAPLKCPG